MKCIFCNPDDEDIILKNPHGYVRYDGFPVSPGHLLIIPFSHISSLFELTDEELMGIWSLVKEGKRILDEKYHPDGFNLGVNVGEAAGQTVFHVHIHLIPRYSGDVVDPRGGVRGVIPGKRRYSERERMRSPVGEQNENLFDNNPCLFRPQARRC